MAYMIEGGGSKTYSKSKKWLYNYPEASHKLLQLLADVCTDHLVSQICAGAQVCGEIIACCYYMYYRIKHARYR